MARATCCLRRQESVRPVLEVFPLENSVCSFFSPPAVSALVWTRVTLSRGLRQSLLFLPAADLPVACPHPLPYFSSHPLRPLTRRCIFVRGFLQCPQSLPGAHVVGCKFWGPISPCPQELTPDWWEFTHRSLAPRALRWSPLRCTFCTGSLSPATR